MFKWLRQIFASRPPQSEAVPEALIRFVYAVDEGDILGCEDCYTLLDEYAELMMDGHDPKDVLPKVHAHLDACPCCDEELHALIAIAEKIATAK